MSPDLLDALDVVQRSVRIAAAATAIVFGPAVVLGYLLARHDFPGKRLVSAITTLPLVLPPTAVGFLLLRLLAAEGVLGRETLGFDLDLLLTWKAAVLASGIMSAPLVVRTARVTFEGIDPRIELMARTLGHAPVPMFFKYTLPMARRGLLAGVILGFTRALGEFGATVTIAGNIPGRTQTLSSAIFEAQQVGDTARGNLLMAIAIGVGFAAILAAELLAGSRAVHGSER